MIKKKAECPYSRYIEYDGICCKVLKVKLRGKTVLRKCQYDMTSRFVNCQIYRKARKIKE